MTSLKIIKNLEFYLDLNIKTAKQKVNKTKSLETYKT